MIRPVALALTLALVGCQSADIPRADPTLAIPAAWRADVGPTSAVEGVWWRNFTIARSINTSTRRCDITATY
ncbi:Uncharacterised protein [Kluyvera cryocrescens]|uniref:Uncharacterized protein n=1 Tax=Kluyvera cryocrescens TaxID=580 RepID=A0A485CPL2_KLUCR|nr:Uncharacterised protein [Kluyvera cryocrescens]